jgi:RNA polymerase sigma-70 factor (ECF subfamily)
VSGHFTDFPDAPNTGDLGQHPRQAVEAACLRCQIDIQIFLSRILRSQHLIDEAWQRTVLNALQASHSVRLPTLRGWLFQIALNEARKILREARSPTTSSTCSITATDPDNTQHPLSTIPAPDSTAILVETQKVVQDCLASLPPEQQEVIRQRVYLGHTFSEIASNLQLPLGTVLTWCRRGLLRLKEDPRLRDLLK